MQSDCLWENSELFAPPPLIFMRFRHNSVINFTVCLAKESLKSAIILFSYGYGASINDPFLFQLRTYAARSSFSPFDFTRLFTGYKMPMIQPRTLDVGTVWESVPDVFFRIPLLFHGWDAFVKVTRPLDLESFIGRLFLTHRLASKRLSHCQHLSILLLVCFVFQFHLQVLLLVAHVAH